MSASESELSMYSDDFDSDDGNRSPPRSTVSTAKHSTQSRARSSRRKPAPPKAKKKVVRRQVTSAANQYVANLESKVSSQDSHIEQLTQELKTLQKIQRRHERALNKYEGSESELPGVLRQRDEEIRALKSQLRNAKEKLQASDSSNKQKDKHLQSIRDKTRHLDQLVKDKGLKERADLQKEIDQLTEKLAAKEEECDKLQRHVQLLSKQTNRTENSRSKETAELRAEIAELEKKCSTLEKQLAEAVRKIEKTNILAARSPKPSPKAEPKSEPIPTSRSPLAREPIPSAFMTAVEDTASVDSGTRTVTPAVMLASNAGPSARTVTPGTRTVTPAEQRRAVAAAHNPRNLPAAPAPSRGVEQTKAEEALRRQQELLRKQQQEEDELQKRQAREEEQAALRMREAAEAEARQRQLEAEKRKQEEDARQQAEKQRLEAEERQRRQAEEERRKAAELEKERQKKAAEDAERKQKADEARKRKDALLAKLKSMDSNVETTSLPTAAPPAEPVTKPKQEGLPDWLAPREKKTRQVPDSVANLHRGLPARPDLLEYVLNCSVVMRADKR